MNSLPSIPVTGKRLREDAAPAKQSFLHHPASAAALCAVLVLSTSGCAATRLGALVPGHSRSEKTKGELLTAQYIRIERASSVSNVKSTKTNRLMASSAIGIQFASLLAGVAVDQVKAELIREAKRYEHQSSTRLLLTTEDLGNEGVIVVTRWIDSKNANTSAGSGKAVAGSSDDKPAAKSIYPNAAERPDGDELVGDFQPQRVDGLEHLDGMLEPKNGKRPAAVLTLRVKREAASVYKVADAKLWVAAVGAKVVNFGWGNLPKVWEWPGALLLKSDSQAEIEAAVNIKSLVGGKDGDFKWNEVKPESGVLSSVKVNLNELPKTYQLSNNVGAWLAVPTVEVSPGTKMGFVVMDFKLNERDTSNAKKYIEQAAEAVDKNRDSIIGNVTKVLQ